MNSYLPVIALSHKLNITLALIDYFAQDLGSLRYILNMPNVQLRKFARECYPDDVEESTSLEFIQFAGMMNIIPAVWAKNFESSCSLELKMFTLMKIIVIVVKMWGIYIHLCMLMIIFKIKSNFESFEKHNGTG